jgi:hypothetical protein
MCRDYDDYTKVYRATLRRARKTHRCDECGRTIEQGEQYEVAQGLSDEGGSWWGGKTCSHCMTARSFLLVECQGFGHTAVLEELAEHWEESPLYHSMWLGRAILGMRRRWRRSDGTLLPVMSGYVSREYIETQP